MSLMVRLKNLPQKLMTSLKRKPTKPTGRRKLRETQNSAADDSLMDFRLYRLAVESYILKSGRPFEHVVKERRPVSNVPLLRYENSGINFFDIT